VNDNTGPREAPERRSLAWRLNWYRQGELDGALLVGRAVEQAIDGYLISRLLQHCADEARHACLWERTLVRLDLPSVRIFRSYQTLCLEYCGFPRRIPEVLALTHVVELRAQQQLRSELLRPGLPTPARRACAALMRVEQVYLDWVGGWLAAQQGAESLLARYRTLDDRVHRQLAPFGDRIWDIPGLGEELAGSATLHSSVRP
jgi:hypothetical protein